MMYSLDNNDFVPPFRDPPSGTSKYFFGGGSSGLLSPYLGFQIIRFEPNIGMVDATGKPSKLTCPSYTGVAGLNTFTYGLNSNNFDPGKYPKLNRVKHPSKTMFIGECKKNQTTTPYVGLYSSTTYEIGYPHSGTVNLVFLDWHTENNNMSKVPNISNYYLNRRGIFWWYDYY